VAHRRSPIGKDALVRDDRDDEITALLSPGRIDDLRTALIRADFTVAGVQDALGLAGSAALARGDLTGAVRAVGGPEARETLIRLFMLGQAVSVASARAALQPLELDPAYAAGLLRRDQGEVRAALDLRPYGEDDPLTAPAGRPVPRDGEPWWVVSDLGSDVRPGPLRSDHVLGVGPAALTLAQATPRTHVARALDIGTGCGIQALHLSRHCGQVTATDVSRRALRMAAATAALSGQRWDLRAGDLLEPVAGARFDLIVANPPFVVGPGWQVDARNDPVGEVPDTLRGFDYRDSGEAGDALCERLIRALPAALAPDGTAQLLANWIIPADGDWTARLTSWLAGSGCDAWVWQREVADLSEYVTLWLRDAGDAPGSASWAQRYGRWMDWFAATEVVGVGMGLITLRRTDGAPTVVCEDVPQAVQQPIGGHVDAWFARAAWLRAHAGDERAYASGNRVYAGGEADAEQPHGPTPPLERLLDQRLRAAPDLVLTTDAMPGEHGWEDRRQVLRLAGGLRWEIEADAPVTALVAGCTGILPLRQVLHLLAASLGVEAEAVIVAMRPVVLDLIRRGLLLPA